MSEWRQLSAAMCSVAVSIRLATGAEVRTAISSVVARKANSGTMVLRVCHRCLFMLLAAAVLSTAGKYIYTQSDSDVILFHIYAS